MHTKQSSGKIISSIFYNYILSNPVCRSLMVPVLSIMILAKYIEVLGAKQTEKLSFMIQNGTRDLAILFKFSLISILIVVLVEIQAFAICKAGQFGYRVANRDVFKYFLDLNPESFNKIGKGEIQNIVSRKSQAVQDMIDVFTLNFFPTFLTIAFVSNAVFQSLGWSTVILINIGVAIYAFLTIKITEWRNVMRKRLNIAQNHSANIAMDSLYNYETIFTYNSAHIEVEKYNSALRRVEKNSTDIARSVYVLNLAQKGVWCFMTIIIMFKSCYRSEGMIRIEKFTFLISILAIVMKSMDNLGFMYGKFKTALLNAEICLSDYEDYKIGGFRTVTGLSTDINVKKLSVKRGNKTIFSNLSFNIKKGEKVAIIGKNGCGKSTMLKSLVNLNKYEGEASIDGININDISDTSFKRLITYVPQNPILFNESVMSNIKYGNNKVFDEDVYKISKDLGLHDSILKLENGYFTNVGEQGKSLSGGERQKVLIIRAILRDSPIVLMDEPTASVDKQSERDIMQSIINMKELTVVAIIHNLDLLKMFDKVLKIENISVTESKSTDFEIISNNQFEMPVSN